MSMALADRMKAARIKRGMTLVQLAERLKVGHPMLSMLEHGEAEASSDLASRIEAWIGSGEGPSRKATRGPYRAGKKRVTTR